jgi:2'-5' RNA ligase
MVDTSAPASQARLFIGLWPDAATRAALAAHRDQWRWTGRARPTRGEKLHLTLHFLGMQPRALMQPLIDGLKTLPFEPFDMTLDQTDLWPRVSGGVTVLQPSSMPAALTALHATAATWLKELCVEPERRPYKPHVTLAHHASGTPAHAVDRAIVWRVQRPVLVESEPAPGGYRVCA